MPSDDEDEYIGIILNFLSSGGDPKDTGKVRLLRRYLAKKGIKKTVKELTLDIEHVSKKMKEREMLDEWEGRLFNPDGEARDRRFRYGSAFCPKCGMFKNYEKECIYCGYHEMTL